eukprot:CAMPEP_0172686388 /NCGR_PEP_ID=MMETSP1074-20121228/20900_1 /TAXON_ID=2916 /ORGANISM="Ceratium fusus, Strain PA161109" /LENGTH=219 /DNA_ID=CAMNT_0013505681 /DNA_START=16 /DNA_END=671 /DNA_ORIENTATION=-
MPPQYSSMPPQHGAMPTQYGSMPPQYGSMPPQYNTMQPQYGSNTPPDSNVANPYGCGSATYMSSRAAGMTNGGHFGLSQQGQHEIPASHVYPSQCSGSGYGWGHSSYTGSYQEPAPNPADGSPVSNNSGSCYLPITPGNSPKNEQDVFPTPVGHHELGTPGLTQGYDSRGFYGYGVAPAPPPPKPAPKPEKKKKKALLLIGITSKSFSRRAQLNQSKLQ